jgi:hypothetical protein
VIDPAIAELELVRRSESVLWWRCWDLMLFAAGASDYSSRKLFFAADVADRTTSKLQAPTSVAFQSESSNSQHPSSNEIPVTQAPNKEQAVRVFGG